MKSVGTRFLCLCILSAFLLGDAKSIQEKERTTAYSERMPIRSQITIQCIRYCAKDPRFPNISKPKHCDCNNPWREIGYLGIFADMVGNRAMPIAAVLDVDEKSRETSEESSESMDSEDSMDSEYMNEFNDS